MDLYILDSLLRRTAVIDQYESLIWTERFNAIGDFEMVIHSSVETRRILTAGLRVTVTGSERVMTIETLEDTEDSGGRSMITVKGRSLEAILTERVARNNFSNLTTQPKWILTGWPSTIARTIFNTVCRNNTLFPEDNIPFLRPDPGTAIGGGAIDEPNTDIRYEIDIMSVYQAIKDLADVYDMGFQLVRVENDPDPSSPKLEFRVYMGYDRTTLQNVAKPVIFSRAFDNLQATTEYTSIAQFKNVAYVYHKNATVVVYADNTSSLVSGLERRVLPVKVDDIDLPAGAELTAALQRRGIEELKKNRSLSAFDGQIAQNSQYRYGIDYKLGDIVEVRNEDGATNNMQVVEQIFVSDEQGTRSYPTLAIDLFITPGSWFAWDYSQTWSEAVGTWSEQD